MIRTLGKFLIVARSVGGRGRGGALRGSWALYAVHGGGTEYRLVESGRTGGVGGDQQAAREAAMDVAMERARRLLGDAAREPLLWRRSRAALPGGSRKAAAGTG
jgi:hypothetical protein